MPILRFCRRATRNSRYQAKVVCHCKGTRKKALSIDPFQKYSSLRYNIIYDTRATDVARGSSRDGVLNNQMLANDALDTVPCQYEPALELDQVNLREIGRTLPIYYSNLPIQPSVLIAYPDML